MTKPDIFKKEKQRRPIIWIAVAGTDFFYRKLGGKL
jgi:hypothetical protein